MRTSCGTGHRTTSAQSVPPGAASPPPATRTARPQWRCGPEAACHIVASGACGASWGLGPPLFRAQRNTDGRRPWCHASARRSGAPRVPLPSRAESRRLATGSHDQGSCRIFVTLPMVRRRRRPLTVRPSPSDPDLIRVTTPAMNSPADPTVGATTHSVAARNLPDHGRSRPCSAEQSLSDPAVKATPWQLCRGVAFGRLEEPVTLATSQLSGRLVCRLFGVAN
jgi:hypothetical protein